MEEIGISSQGDGLARVVGERARRMGLALCESVSLDPSNVTDIRADYSAGTRGDEVMVTATVVHKISATEFNRILNESNAF